MVVFLRFIEGSFDILVNRLHKYCGAKLLRDLKTIVLDSLSISSPMVFQSGFFISVKPGVSKLLPVTIRAALVCIFATGFYYIAQHCIALHSIRLQCIRLQCIVFILHCVTVCCVAR